MKKRLLSILLAMSLAFSFTACGKKSEGEASIEKDDEVTDESYSYNISALLSNDNSYDEILLKGFSDCLSDYLGADHITITTSKVSEEASADQLAKDAVKNAPDMIFTTGKATLTAATERTETVPIVATGIVDFKTTLRIASLNGKSWDKTTGKNVTGVSSKPSIVDQVSLMIEATKDLQTVGILFSPEDTDAIYQNEIFEAYLDQAGIPWKEYLIPAGNTSIEVDEAQESNALSPSKFVAFSAKEGMDNDVEALGDGLITGLNSPSSTRVALTSQFWKNGKIVATHQDEETEEPQEATDSDKSADKDEDEEEAVPTLEELITEACSECSAIYIPFGSMLTDQMDVIGGIATEANVVIVAGDTAIGENALVTLFADPYSLGYAAGKKAVRVFNGDDIATIKIGYGDADESVKLYNGAIAEKFEMEFPKSFKEYSEFLETYEYGSQTTRYSKSGEEE